MSEKRFSYGETDLFEWVEENGEMISTRECANKLNEQQDTIITLKRRLEKINGGYGHLTHRNGLTANEWVIERQEKELKKKNEQISDWIEQHSKDIVKIGEQQTTIRSLKKENRALNSIKKFAEDNGINIFYIDTAFRNCWNDNAKLIEENEQLRKQIQNYEQLISNSMSKKQCCDCEHFGLSKDPFRVITGTCGRCGKEVGYTDKCLFEEESFDKYLTERLNEKEEIIKEQERRIIVLENLLTNIGVKWVDDYE